METRTIKAGESFTYEHPGERDGAPAEVARDSARDLERASAMFARHAAATVRQVRNGFMSRELSRDPDLTAEELAAVWTGSETERDCLILIRAAKAANTAVKRVREKHTRGV